MLKKLKQKGQWCSSFKAMRGKKCNFILFFPLFFHIFFVINLVSGLHIFLLLFALINIKKIVGKICVLVSVDHHLQQKTKQLSTIEKDISQFRAVHVLFLQGKWAYKHYQSFGLWKMSPRHHTGAGKLLKLSVFTVLAIFSCHQRSIIV